MHRIRGRDVTVRALLVLTLAAAGTAVTGAPAVAATPEAGAPCSRDDLGQRFGNPDTVTVEPTLTHFKAYNVAPGTTGQQIVKLTLTERISVTLMSETSVTGEFSFLFFTKVTAAAKFAVTKVTESTSNQEETITWNFNQPGYYGFYKGVRKVTGRMSTLNCARVVLPNSTVVTQWVVRPGGNYTTWGRPEEGVVRCEDVVPEGTVRRTAQREMGCDDVLAGRRPRVGKQAEPAKAGQARAGQADLSTTRAAAIPPGFVCDSRYHKINAANGLILDMQDKATGRPVRWQESASGGSWQWLFCTGTSTDGHPPVVIMNRGSGLCLQPRPGSPEVEGNEIQQFPCSATSAQQRFIIYRDVPGSTAAGIQSIGSGAMLGTPVLEAGKEWLQFRAGLADGTGTVQLTPL